MTHNVEFGVKEAAMKLTKWFSIKAVPVRTGWYEWKDSSAMRYWDGERWLDSLMHPMPFFKPWRGQMTPNAEVTGVPKARPVD
mgnify:CR=1 FL=1